MNLSFKESFPDGTQTYFLDKILTGLYYDDKIDIFPEYRYYSEQYYKEFGCFLFNADYPGSAIPKYTSIREDKADRWQPGSKIHFIINNRTKNRFQFAPVIEVKSIQKIQIKYYDFEGAQCVHVGIDYTPHYTSYTDFFEQDNNMLRIAQNDGFESIEQFFKWFNKDFTGKIIHWTDLKY